MQSKKARSPARKTMILIVSLLLCMFLRPGLVSASVVISKSSSGDRIGGRVGDLCTMKAGIKCSKYEDSSELRACVDVVLSTCLPSGTRVLTRGGAAGTSTTTSQSNAGAVRQSLFLLNRVIGDCTGYRKVQVERMQRICHDGRCTWFKYYVPEMKCIPV